MHTIPDNYYRTSVKALILNDEKKFLLTKESDGKWELPGGGLDFGETPQECLRREIKEEMGLEATYIATQPAYFYAVKHSKYQWITNVLFEVTLENLDFTASDECTEIRFFTKYEALKEELFSNVQTFLEVFDPKNHRLK